jgi:hypothetical protein
MNVVRQTRPQHEGEVAGRVAQKSTDFYPKVITGFVTMPVNAEERL